MILKLINYDFKDFLNSINKCYSEEIQDRLPKDKDFPESIFDPKKNVNIKLLIKFAESKKDVYILSVIKRIQAVALIQLARDTGSPLNIKLVWKLISDSILNIPNECSISSVGSQGFLSIPIFKYDKILSEFDFIRLHIWDESLLQYINKEISNLFSIHSHAFMAQSWIIAGKIANRRHTVNITDSKTNSSLFKIEYNETLNKVNQHSSNAVNTFKNILIKETSKEEYSFGESYKIKAGEYHNSLSLENNELSATFFSFTGQKQEPIQSYVTGPSTIEISPINRKMHINPTALIKAIDTKISLK